jgi:hypothetical protein
LTSHRDQVSWAIGELIRVDGNIECGSNGLHASTSPRDSLGNVYGQRWFISEARGEISHGGNKFATAEMRLITEISPIVLRRFAVWCAADCLASFEGKHPEHNLLADCIEAAGAYLDGAMRGEESLSRAREAAEGALGSSGLVVQPLAPLLRRLPPRRPYPRRMSARGQALPPPAVTPRTSPPTRMPQSSRLRALKRPPPT